MGVVWRVVEAARVPSAGALGWSHAPDARKAIDPWTCTPILAWSKTIISGSPTFSLSPAPDASKVQRLLALDLLPAPPIPRGYAIWSEGLLAEAFACFPTTAFPALCERLRSATAHQDTSRLYKALTMWGDRFATALSAWLASDTLRVQARAIHGLTLYAKGLNALCDVETPSLASCLHQINYPELVRFTRDWDLGVAPAALLSGHPPPCLSAPSGLAGGGDGR